MWVHQSTVTRQADAYLVAVAAKMLVQQGLELHAFQLSAQEQRSSIRSLIMVSISVVPRPYHNVRNRSKFERIERIDIEGSR
jgi:hypothetical protein